MCVEFSMGTHTMNYSLINIKSTVLYPDPRFRSITVWPSMPKKDSNRLINQSLTRLVVMIHMISTVVRTPVSWTVNLELYPVSRSVEMKTTMVGRPHVCFM